MPPEGAYSDALRHEPVMRAEVLHWLAPEPGDIIVDGTLGGGGHAAAICEQIGPTGTLVGIEQDAQALAYAERRLQGCPVRLVHDNFRHLDNILTSLAIDRVDGVLLDLGVSSFQLETPDRGFSFRFEAPLDMRMDRRADTTAMSVLAQMSQEDMVRILEASGYGRWARRLARAITASRQHSPITTTKQFADLVAATIPAAAHSKIHPATKAFQALRIAVNDELAALTEALIAATHRCNTTARIVVISYHSLEDGATKEQFRFLSGRRPPPSNPYAPEEPAPPKLLEILTKKPLIPSPEEVHGNPRSRSAKMRVAERV